MGLAATVLPIATGLALLIAPQEDDAPFLLFLLAAILASWFGGWRMGLGCVVLGTVAMAVAESQPAETSGWSMSSEPIEFAAVAGIVLALTAGLRSSRRLAVAERAQRQTEALRIGALEELDRMKTQFVGAASHELRTPLTKIRGFLEIVVADTRPDDPRHEMLAIAYDEASRLASLVEDILDVSQIGAGRVTLQPVVVDLDTALAGVAAAMPPSAAHPVSIAVAPDARWVLADAARLQQIVTNLLSNAIKYAPAGGPVRIATRADGAGRVVVEVSDRGIGISPALRERIFEGFERGDAAARGIPGTGLGLFIVRQLVELHGGTTSVESVPGAGSMFWFTLPAASAQSTQQPVDGARLVAP